MNKFSDGSFIIKQHRRQTRISAFFSISMFGAAIGLIIILLLFQDQFEGFDLFNAADFVQNLNILRFILSSISLVFLIAIMAGCAYFIRVRPRKRENALKTYIQSAGKNTVGEIIRMDVFKKSRYETDYMTFLKLEDGNETAFCFYLLANDEPLPLGEKWSLVYDDESKFAILTKRIRNNRNEAV